MKKRHVKLMIPLLVSLLSVFLLVPCALAAGESYLSVRGAIFEAEVTPGNTYTHVMSVTSASDAPPLEIMVEARGFGQSPDGSTVELTGPEDLSPFSARPYITNIDKPSFSLSPGSSEQITVTISVPANIEPVMKYALIYIHTKPHGEGHVGVVVAANVPVVLKPAGLTPITAGQITALTVERIEAGKPITVLTTLRNTGNYHYKAKNRVTIKDSQGKTVTTGDTPLTSSSIIPNFTRTFVNKVSLGSAEGLAPGNYLVESQVITGDGNIIDVGQTNFTIDKEYLPLPGVNKLSILKKIFHNEEPGKIDAIKEAGLEVTFTGTGKGTGTILIGKYDKEPEHVIPFTALTTEGGTGKTFIKAVDVNVSGYHQGIAHLNLRYTDSEIAGVQENSLFLAYWNGKRWQNCDQIKVFTGANAISGDVPVSALTGTPIGLGGDLIDAEANLVALGNKAATSSPPPGNTPPAPVLTPQPITGIEPLKTDLKLDWSLLTLIALGIVTIGLGFFLFASLRKQQ